MGIRCPRCRFENPDDTVFCGKCATPLPTSEEVSATHTETLSLPFLELTRGSLLGERFEIIEELGRGGMGNVYRVEDKKIHEEVALKLLKPEIASDRKTIERFRNELKTARRISHRNVCRMYDLGEEKGAYFITMEYVPGEDLRSFIKRSGQLTVEKAVHIAKQVCEGLGEAHRLGIVHRDLKPSNIMIDRDGNARIMDFGIARAIKTKGITGVGKMIGTPEYMSPEQAEAGEVDQRSDVYSMGVILYIMLTGRVPFEGDTPLSVAMKHRIEKPRNPKELNVQIPEALSRVILKCMEKDKEKRFQNTDELLSELTEIEKNLSPKARIEPKRKPLTSKEIAVRFNLQKLAVLVVLLVVCAATAVLLWRYAFQKPKAPLLSEKPSLAVMYFTNNTGDETLDHWRRALSDLLIADLSQSKYIRVMSGANLFNILQQLNQQDTEIYSSEVLKQVGSRGKTQYVLVGDYAKAGDEFRINLMLQETNTGELMSAEGVEGRGEENIFAMVDELTRKIKSRFQLSDAEIADDIDEEVQKITTSSPEAYKSYNEGIQFYRQAAYRRCIESMEKAIAIDPDFAMAFRTVAYAYETLGYSGERQKYLEQALNLKDRISERERYLIEGDFYRHSEETTEFAIAAYTKLLDLYPEEWIGSINLGIMYHGLEQWDKAVECFEISTQNPAETYFSAVNQAQSYAALGKYDKAKQALQDYLNNFSDNATIRWYLSRNYLYEGKYDLAIDEAEKASSLNPDMYHNILLKGDIYHLKMDLEQSEREYRNLLQSQEKAAHMYGRSSLSALFLLQGKFRDSIKQLQQAAALARELEEGSAEFGFLRYLASMYVKISQPEKALEVLQEAWNIAVASNDLTQKKSVIYDRSVVFMAKRSIDESIRAAEELRRMILNSINQKEIRHYHYLRGLIEAGKKNFSGAVSYYQKALSLVPSQYAVNNEHALFLFGLASAYHQAGEPEKARVEYEKIIPLTISRLYYGDIYAKSFYILGKIYQAMGWEGKALDSYENFLKLWNRADPGHPEVLDARKQLSVLENED